MSVFPGTWHGEVNCIMSFPRFACHFRKTKICNLPSRADVKTKLFYGEKSIVLEQILDNLFKVFLRLIPELLSASNLSSLSWESPLLVVRFDPAKRGKAPKSLFRIKQEDKRKQCWGSLKEDSLQNC